MRFELPVQYHAAFVKKGHRSPSSVDMLTSAPFEVREVPVGAAVLAFEAGHDLKTKYESIRFRRFEQRPARVWLVEGTYYTECVGVDQFVESVSGSWTDRGNILAVFGERSDSVPCSDGIEDARKKATTYEEVLRREGVLRSWEDDGGASRIQGIQQRLNDLIVVDGMVCAAVAEPTIIVTPMEGFDFEDERPVAVYLAIVEMKNGTKISSGGRLHHDLATHSTTGRRFRIDQMQAATAFAARMAKTLDCQVVDATAIGKVTSAGLIFSGESEAVMAAANFADTVLSPLLAALPKEVALAWYRLRDAKMAAGGGVTEDLVAAVEELRRAVAGDEGLRSPVLTEWQKHWNSKARDVSHVLGYRSAGITDVQRNLLGFLCTEAIEAWHERPLTGEYEWAADTMSVVPMRGKGVDVSEVTTTAELVEIADALRMAPETLLAMRKDRGFHYIHIECDGERALAAVRADFGRYELQDHVSAAFGRHASDRAAQLAQEFIDRANRELDMDAVLSVAM